MEIMIQRSEEDIAMAAQVTIGPVVGAGGGKIHAGEVSVDREEGLANEVAENMVKVDPQLASCCIDGRNCLHTMSGSAAETRASVAGGALTTAFAAAELTDWFGADVSSTPVRLGRVNRLLASADIKAGTHVDQTAVETGFMDAKTGLARTGCGAADGFPTIINGVYQQPETVQSLTAAIMGDEYDQKVMLFPATAHSEGRFTDWSSTDIVDACGGDTENNVEILESDETPTHGHREIAVVFNYKKDTTLDRDSFVARTGEQVFCVDVWYIDKLAKAMATGPNATEQYKQLKHAMVAYQVATYLALCDGSQRIITVR